MRRIEKQLHELEFYIPKYNQASAAVSAAAMGWHIEHCLLTIRRIIHAVQSSDEKNYKPVFKVSKFIILTSGIIPRGRATAPKEVQPPAPPDIASLKESMYKTRKLLAEMERVSGNQHFTHPIFGHLNKKPALRFLEVHTRHHLKIIRDIARAKN